MFYIVSSLIIILMNFVGYRGLFAKTEGRSLHKFLLAVFFATLAVGGVLLAFSLRFNFLNAQFRLAFSLMLALSFILFSFVLVSNLIIVFFRPVTKRVFSKSRRKFLRFYLDVTILILALSYFFKGMYNASHVPQVKPQEVRLKGLKEPLKIAMITDVHLGDFLGVPFAKALVERINLLDADAVVIVGDIADLHPKRLGEYIAPFAEFKSRYGTFYVPGNHEYYHGIEGALKEISKIGIKVLGNESVQVGGINLAGVYDLIGYRYKFYEPDLEAALKNTDKNLPTVLLAHQPKFIRYMHKDVDLVLCGHTHGGQIFPFSLLVKLDQKYLAGLYQVNDKMQVYVSRGAGFWGPPVRVLAPSEISLLELKGE